MIYWIVKRNVTRVFLVKSAWMTEPHKSRGKKMSFSVLWVRKRNSVSFSLRVKQKLLVRIFRTTRHLIYIYSHGHGSMYTWYATAWCCCCCCSFLREKKMFVFSTGTKKKEKQFFFGLPVKIQLQSTLNKCRFIYINLIIIRFNIAVCEWMSGIFSFDNISNKTQENWREVLRHCLWA